MSTVGGSAIKSSSALRSLNWANPLASPQALPGPTAGGPLRVCPRRVFLVVLLYLGLLVLLYVGLDLFHLTWEAHEMAGAQVRCDIVVVGCFYGDGSPTDQHHAIMCCE
jgi:hypothetical protein